MQWDDFKKNYHDNDEELQIDFLGRGNLFEISGNFWRNLKLSKIASANLKYMCVYDNFR